MPRPPIDGLTLVLGGARSGKSSLALRCAVAHDGPVAYVATAPNHLDDDLDARIARHRTERPDTWTTVEEPLDLVGAVAAIDAAEPATFVIVDCLTLWTSNEMWAGRDDETIERRATAAAAAFADRAGPSIVISNEVGMGIHPEAELGRRYRDVLGRVNQEWSARAQRSLLLVAGRAMTLADPDELLGR